MRDAAHQLPPIDMRPLSLASYAVLQAVGSRYLSEDAQAVDAVVWWYVHSQPIHHACALSQCSAAQAEIVALAACDLTPDALDTIHAWAQQSIAVLESSRAEQRGADPHDSKN